jgi:hypothetical protein
LVKRGHLVQLVIVALLLSIFGLFGKVWFGVSAFAYLIGKTLLGLVCS